MSVTVPPFKKKKIVYGLNALLVALTLLLAYRVLSPNYERQETTSANKLGMFHTQLAAERATTKLSNLREELRENGMRLVDPTRGPVTLDASRWLWLRIQDRDWRAPKYLEPLPSPQMEVDTWAVRSEKSTFVLSERVPIMKDGVQDFVLLEGGLRPTVFQDLQTDANFGFWLFDLKAYEKGGIGAAKIYEKGSDDGLLAKDEVKLLTSDMLMRLFQNQEPVVLDAKLPWVVAFKNTSGPARLGVLGYWLPDAEPVQDLTTIWISLAIALFMLSGLFSYYIIYTYKAHEEVVAAEIVELAMPAVNKVAAEESAQKAETSNLAAKIHTRIFNGLFDWLYSFAQQSKIPYTDLKDRVQGAIEISGRGASPQLEEINNLLQGSQSNFEKLNSFFGRFDSYFGDNEGKVEIFDPEVFYLEFARAETDLPKVETYFDPDIWRIRASKAELSYLLNAYIRFLYKDATPENKLHLSARFVSSETEDAGAIEVVSSEYFKVPFMRFYIHLATQMPIGRTQIYDLFDFAKVKNAREMDLALTQRVVSRMGARLKVKSNFEDGNVIILDLPAHEERKAEDKVNAKQLTELKGDDRFAQGNPFTMSGRKAQQEEPSMIESKTVVSSSGLKNVPAATEESRAPVVNNSPAPELEPGESFEEPKEAMRLSEIERANSFAEGISDERSRVRSRFRIRKPGEKE